MANLKANIIEAHIFRRNGNDIEFLLLKRAEGEIYPGLWQMVSGSKEEGETSHDAALREVFEETGIQPANFWAAPVVNSYYNPVTDLITMIPVFLIETAADCVVSISQEHSEYKWAGKAETISLLAWAGQRNAVEICHEYITKDSSYLKFIEINLTDKG